jgi:hypothetical protein
MHQPVFHSCLDQFGRGLGVARLHHPAPLTRILFQSTQPQCGLCYGKYIRLRKKGGGHQPMSSEEKYEKRKEKVRKCRRKRKMKKIKGTGYYMQKRINKGKKGE